MLRTRSCPSCSAGSDCSAIAKFSGVGSPTGREARVTTRGDVGWFDIGLELHAADEAAIDDEVGTGDGRRGGAGEEGDRPRDVRGGAETAEWDARLHRVVELGSRVLDPLPRAALELDRTWGAGVDAYALGREGPGE